MELFVIDMLRSLHIALLGQVVNEIEHHLPPEPTCLVTARHLARVQRFLLRNLVRLSAGALRCSVGKELDMAAFIQQIEPIDSFLDCLANSQKTVVAEKSCALVAESLRDVVAFVFGEDDAFAVEYDVVLSSLETA